MQIPPLNQSQTDKGFCKTSSLEASKLKTQCVIRVCFKIWALVGLGLIVGALVYLLNILSMTVGILVWTLVIVFCLRGVVNFLEQKGIPRAAGTGIAYVLLLVAGGLLGALLLSPTIGFGDQVSNLLRSIPDYIHSLTAWGNALYSRYSNIFQDEMVHRWLTDASTSLAAWASDLARNSAGGVVAFSSSVASLMLTLSFALVIAFWILVELPALGRETMRLAGDKYREDLTMLHLSLTRIMGGYIRGTFLQCTIIGLLCGVLFAFLKLPDYAALGAITGLFNIIPVVGPWVGGLLAAVVGVFISPLVGLAALVGTIIIQQIIYTFVSPRIMASSVDVHPVLILLALTAGSALGGAMSGFIGAIVGMLASIPLVAVAKSIFVYYFEKRTGRRLVAQDGVFFQGMPRGDSLDPMGDATSPHPHATASFPKVSDVTGRFKLPKHRA